MNRSLCLVLALVASVALGAGETAGRISGWVTDPTGAPLAEVPLVVTSAALQQPIAATSGGDGRYEVHGLPPGEDYVVEVTVPGFSPIRRERVRVLLGQSTSMDVRLEVLSSTAPVATYEIVETVHPVLNPDSAQSVAVVTAEKAAASPIFHQVEGIPQQAPGVGPGSRPSTRGGFARYGKFYVDGLDTTDITDGSITAPMNFDAVENFEVITGGMDAQYNALGMVENVVTRSGGNRFTYDVSAVLAPSLLTVPSRVGTGQSSFVGAPLSSDTPTPETSFYSPVLNLGGPIVKDRLWFFVSGQLNRSNREALISTPYSAEESRSTVTRTDLARLKLTWQPTTRDRMSLGLNVDRNQIDRTVGAPTVTLDAEQQISRSGYFVIANYDRTLTDRLLFQLQAGMTNKNVAVEPQQDTDAAAHVDTATNVTQFNGGRVVFGDTTGNWLHERKQRFQFDPAFLWTVGAHQLKGGVQLSLQKSAQRTGVTGGARYLDRGGVCNPDDPASFGACSQRVDFYDADGVPRPLELDASVATAGVFLQDRWTVTRKLTLVPGARFDVGRLAGNGGALITTLMGVGPRFGATYDLFADRRSLLSAYYGRANDVGNIAVAQHANPSLLQVTSSFANGAFPDCAPGAIGAGCQVSGGPAGRHFDARPRAPTMDEVSVGYKQEVHAATVLGVDVTWRRYSHQWADEETNRIYDASGTRILGGVDGTTQSILRIGTPAGAYRAYRGADLWIQGNPGRWDLLASYTIAFAEGTVNDYFDGFGVNPRFVSFSDGPVSDDRRHTLKGMITWKSPAGVDLGVRAAYRTGNPLWESFANAADGSQRSYRSPRGTGYASAASGVPDFNDPSSWAELRNPSQLQLDVQARYDVGPALGLQATRLEIVGLVVNVLNSTEPTALSDQYATRNNRFGLVSSRQAPLQGQLVLRVRN